MPDVTPASAHGTRASGRVWFAHCRTISNEEYAMNLNISGHHMDLTDALRDYVSNKMQRIERHFDHVIDAEVVLEVKKTRRTAVATLLLSGKKLHAEATQDDMYAAIDQMVDRLDNQTRKFKDKRRDHNVKSAHRMQPSGA